MKIKFLILLSLISIANSQCTVYEFSDYKEVVTFFKRLPDRVFVNRCTEAAFCTHYWNSPDYNVFCFDEKEGFLKAYQSCTNKSMLEFYTKLAKEKPMLSCNMPEYSFE